MGYELISKQELDDLSEDDDEAFVEAEAICRRNATEGISQDDSNSGSYAEEMRLQYMTMVSALADQFGVPNLRLPDLSEYDGKVYWAYSEFTRRAQAEAVKIVARNRRSRRASSVELSSRARARIEQEISNLRRAIDREPDLAGSLKRSLLAKLDELEADLRNNRRLNIAKTMLVLAAVAAAVGNVGSSIAGIAEAPAALTNIMHLIGAEKAAEEAEALRLSGPPKALPAPRKAEKAAVSHAHTPSKGPSWDEEIPF